MSGGDAMSAVSTSRRRGVLLGVGGAMVVAGLLTAIFAMANARDDVGGAAVAKAPLGTRAACTAYSGLPPAWREAARAGMVRVRGASSSWAPTVAMPMKCLRVSPRA